MSTSVKPDYYKSVAGYTYKAMNEYLTIVLTEFWKSPSEWLCNKINVETVTFSLYLSIGS
jgi:hypothetical protein